MFLNADETTIEEILNEVLKDIDENPSEHTPVEQLLAIIVEETATILAIVDHLWDNIEATERYDTFRDYMRAATLTLTSEGESWGNI